MYFARKVNKKLDKGKIIKIQTTADKMINKNLSEIGGKGLFSKELDEALINKKIDLAVHSLKDLPTIISKYIDLAYILPRGSYTDILISGKNIKNLNDFPTGSKIGTSSPRRFAQIKSIRPDINIIPIRGNIQTRLKKINNKDIDAIILASAGIRRLKIKVNFSVLRSPNFLTTAGQGIIAITYLKSNIYVKKMLSAIKNYNTSYQANAERAVLEKLNGDCNSAIAVNSKIKNNNILIKAIVYSSNGSTHIRETVNGKLGESYFLGLKLGDKLIKLGALKLLQNESH